jgi:hypothetical protein
MSGRERVHVRSCTTAVFTSRTIMTLVSMVAMNMTEVLFSTTATLLGFSFLHNMGASASINFMRSRIFVEVAFGIMLGHAAMLTGQTVVLH